MTTRTVADISDEIQTIQFKIKVHTKAIEKLKKLMAPLEAELLAEADVQKLTAGKGTSSSFEIKEETVPQASNWDDFYQFMKDNDYFHLLHKRFSTKAISELWELGKTIPGVNKYTCKKVIVKGV